jgi:hypothetical protein
MGEAVEALKDKLELSVKVKPHMRRINGKLVPVAGFDREGKSGVRITTGTETVKGKNGRRVEGLSPEAVKHYQARKGKPLPPAIANLKRPTNPSTGVEDRRTDESSADYLKRVGKANDKPKTKAQERKERDDAIRAKLDEVDKTEKDRGFSDYGTRNDRAKHEGDLERNKQGDDREDEHEAWEKGEGRRPIREDWEENEISRLKDKIEMREAALKRAKTPEERAKIEKSIAGFRKKLRNTIRGD